MTVTHDRPPEGADERPGRLRRRPRPRRRCAMVREGNRRVRRRRNAVLGAGVAAVVGRGDRRIHHARRRSRHGRATRSSPQLDLRHPQPACATGSTVHVGDRSFDVGRPVRRRSTSTTAGSCSPTTPARCTPPTGRAAEEIGSRRQVRTLVGDGSLRRLDRRSGRQRARVHGVRPGDRRGRRSEFDTGAGEGATEYHASLFAIDGDDVYLRDAEA